MSLKRKFLTAIAMSAMISTTAIANAGPSQADTIHKFRLSQFAAVVANVCVHTDVETVCTGNWPTNRSEVFDVRANSPHGWWCDAEEGGGGRVSTERFTRDYYKECRLDGTAFWFEISTVAPS
jgi:hypothetical protein